ncbi:MAG: hypothetical protein AABY88_04590 [Pseudomonadota bacterium]
MSELDDRKAEVANSKSRLMTRIDEIRSRVQPASLMTDVKMVARKRAISAATIAVSQCKARPIIAVGAISAGLAYLFRKPLLNALAKRLQPEKNDDK